MYELNPTKAYASNLKKLPPGHIKQQPAALIATGIIIFVAVLHSFKDFI
jgi:hypothetical protein